MITAMIIITVMSLIVFIYFAYANRLNEKLKNHQESKFVNTKPSPYKGKLRLAKQFSLICVLMLGLSSISLIEGKKVLALENRSEYLELMSMPSNIQKIDTITISEYTTRAIEFNDAIYLSKNDGLVKVDGGLTEMSTRLATNNTLFVMDNKIVSYSCLNNYQSISIYNPDTLIKENTFETINATILEANLKANVLSVYLNVQGVELEELDLIYNGKDISLNYKDIYYIENVSSNQMFVHVKINTKTKESSAKAIMLPEFYLNASESYTYINFNSRTDEFGFTRSMIIKYNSKTMRIKDYEEFGGTTCEKVAIVDGKIKLVVGASLAEENRYTVYTLNKNLNKIKEENVSLSTDEVLVTNKENALSQSVTIDKIETNALLKMFVQDELVIMNNNNGNINIHLVNSNIDILPITTYVPSNSKVLEVNVNDNKLQAIIDAESKLIYVELDIKAQDVILKEYQKDIVSEIYLTNNYFVVVEENIYHIYDVNERK